MSDEDYKKIFSQNLKYYMSINNKNQMDLMTDLKLSSSTVSNWCTGQKLPRMDKVQMLADYFDIKKSDLIESKNQYLCDNINIGKKIKEQREKLGMTQEELAYRLGYKNKSSIAKIEIGMNDITQSKVTEFATILNTTPTYLMGWEEKSSSFPLEPLEKKIITEYRKADEISQAMVLRALSIDESEYQKKEGSA